MKKFVLFLLVSLTLSCQDSTSPNQSQPKLGEKFKLEFGQQIIIQKENIRIQFNKVIDDSRCPKGVSCFWAGNAKIVIQLNSKKVNLNTYLDPKQTTISGYEVKLISLNPYPKYDVDIQEKEYVAILNITKK